MFKVKSSIFFFLSCVVIAGLGCVKTKQPALPALPAETHQGLQTAGFYLNGELYLPKTISTGLRPFRVWVGVDNFFYLSIVQYNKTLTVTLSPIKGAGKYELPTTQNRAVFIVGSVSYTCISGFINITTYDVFSGIIAGTFELQAKSDAGDTVSITLGRFDAKI